MSDPLGALQENAIKQHCKHLHLPTIAGQCARLADQAERERRGYLGYLDALLLAELEEREQKTVARRIKDARPKALGMYFFNIPALSTVMFLTMRFSNFSFPPEADPPSADALAAALLMSFATGAAARFERNWSAASAAGTDLPFTRSVTRRTLRGV